jgi:protein gp37
MGHERYANGFKVTLHWDLITVPYRWKKSRRVFINSMSDLFHPDIPDKFIQAVFKTMSECPMHQFQLLTKRSERLKNMASDLPWTLNIWVGVSVEDKTVVGRIEHLGNVPAAVRFLSCEPLIGPLASLPLSKVDWVIAGGESGPGARPIRKSWVESILRQCRENQVPFFFKQWGGYKKWKNGRILNGRTYDEMPVPKIHRNQYCKLPLVGKSSSSSSSIIKGDLFRDIVLTGLHLDKCGPVP